ncbi:MAG: helix-turn-helix domain protein [Amycolatopsis sp.]|uniref:DUF397 domain-containing protein n=1 Tax=Amycolatopsis sp. TaxID=37632 RepID=UPI00260A01A9|nr:DUF397 domain-containing protein [Amycolatopsis sp.]MCU1680347.1 helix-turn-helix domain protein [Amycolatopsis sp.]
MTLARQAKRRDWWKTYPNTVLGRTTDLLELEADADSVHYFTLDAIPGLLQTESYAAAVMQHGFPRESADELEQRVAVRMARQQHVDPARAAWRKSQASSSNNACVEVALSSDAIGIRDTKDRAAGHLVLAPGSWSAFLEKAARH